MRKIMKRLAALAVVSTMALTTLVGCATTSSVDNSEVVATVGDSQITAGVANFYLRYQQSGMEELYAMYFGEDFWTSPLTDGSTYAKNLKNQVINTLHEFYVLEDHMADYNVTLTDAELAAIESHADAFVEANSADVVESVSGQKEVVVEMLKLFTINEKMYQAMTVDVDTEVADEDAAQKRLRYYSVSKTKTENGATVEMTESEIDALKKEMNDFLDGAKANGSLEAYGEEKEVSTYTLTFDSESVSIAEEVIEIADLLKEGEFGNVIETDSLLYVIQLESEFDREATDAKKAEIVEDRKIDAYSEIAEKWLEETAVEVNEEVWDQLSVETLKVLAKEQTE